MKTPHGASFGVIGLTAVAACCAAHVLVVVVAGASLSALTGSLALVAYVALGIFVLLLTYAFRRSRKKRRENDRRAES
ncbi:MAG: hypothetical protein ACE5FO_01290 [Parvularculaceae bacterium]